MPEDRLVIRRPDDWHVHLRDGTMLEAVAPYTAQQFGRAIVMPNLSPPITTVAEALAYRSRIAAAVPAGSDFEPLMTAYLTDTISSDQIERGYDDNVFTACKLYPAHATTNADHGVTSVALILRVLETLQRIGCCGLGAFGRQRWRVAKRGPGKSTCSFNQVPAWRHAVPNAPRPQHPMRCKVSITR